MATPATATDSTGAVPPALLQLVSGNGAALAPSPGVQLPNAPGTSATAAPPAMSGTPPAVAGILSQSDPKFDEFWARMVPGESGGKDVPNYRYDPTHTASGQAQITDTNWKAWAPRLGIDTTKYPTAMSAPLDYQKAVTKLGHRMYGDTPWDVAHGGGLPGASAATPDASGIIDAAKARQQSAFDEAAKEQDQLQAAIKKIGSSGRDPEIQQQLVDARARADAATDRAMKLIENPPQMQDSSIVQKMGGLATIVGILGGLVTKQPFLGSMSAAAAAVNAYNQGDLRKYQMARDSWKTQSDLLFKIAEINNGRVTDILRDQQMSDNEKTAELNAQFSAMGAERQIETLKQGGLGAVEDAQKMQFDAAEKWAVLQRQEQIAHDNRIAQADLNHPENQIYRDIVTQSEAGLGRPLTPEERGQALAQAKGSVLTPEVTTPKSWDGMPEKAPPHQRQDIWDMALAFVRTGQMPAMGFAPSIRPMVVALEPAAREALGIKPTEVADVRAQYAGEKHAEVLLGGRTANLGMALNEAKQFIPMGDDASAKVDRTQVPSLNAAYEAVLMGTGDENIVRLVTATNAISNAYAQVAARGGQSTDAARAQAHEILNNAFSKGQYAVAADQMMREINAAQTAPVATQNDILKAFSAKWNAVDAPKYFVGQVIDTPKGKVFVTGGDLSGNNPEVRPAQ